MDHFSGEQWPKMYKCIFCGGEWMAPDKEHEAEAAEAHAVKCADHWVQKYLARIRELEAPADQ